MATLWRLLPVTTLTLRQFTGGRTARLALALSLIPALFAVIYVLRPWGVTPGGFLGDLFRELFLPTCCRLSCSCRPPRPLATSWKTARCRIC